MECMDIDLKSGKTLYHEMKMHKWFYNRLCYFICYVSLIDVIGTALKVKLMYKYSLWKQEQLVSREVAIYVYIDDKCWK